MESQFTASRWLSLSRRVGIPNPDSIFAELLRYYSESWRSYHSLHHIDDCLRRFDESPLHGEHPDELEIAIWFHDAVYDTSRSDNESRSAEMAVSVLQGSSLCPVAIDRVRASILATTHDSSPNRLDEQIIVDIDLSILGREETHFDRFESSIREEYAWVPWSVYAEKRSDILRSFLSRQRIYSTTPFYARFESNARANLAKAIHRLEGQPRD